MKRSIFLAFLIASSIISFSQERKDEELPKLVGTIQTISNLSGRAKNDFGKWVKAFNGSPFGEQTIKIDLTKISYEGKEYWCISKFYKNIYFKGSLRKTEYAANFWVFDIDTGKSFSTSDTSIYTGIYTNVIAAEALPYSQPVSWKDVLIQIKKCFIGTYPNGIVLYPDFFIKFRYDNKLNHAQFYLGSLSGFSLFDKEDLDFAGGALCYDKEKNANLGCCYYEVPRNIFDKAFSNIIK